MCSGSTRNVQKNIRILSKDWIRKSEPAFACSNLGLYSLEIPNVERTDQPGRHKVRNQQERMKVREVI